MALGVTMNGKNQVHKVIVSDLCPVHASREISPTENKAMTPGGEMKKINKNSKERERVKDRETERERQWERNQWDGPKQLLQSPP